MYNSVHYSIKILQNFVSMYVPPSPDYFALSPLISTKISKKTVKILPAHTLYVFLSPSYHLIHTI